MEWIKSLSISVTSGVNMDHPIILLIVFCLVAANEIGLPLFFTLEILLFFISFRYGPWSSQSLLVVLILLTGREFGANVLYLAEHGLGSRFLDWLERRSLRTMDAVEKFKARLNNKPIILIAMMRITPGLLQVPSIAAGAVHLRPVSFIGGVAFSSLISDFIIVFLGFSVQFLLPSSDIAT